MANTFAAGTAYLDGYHNPWIMDVPYRTQT